MIPSPSRPVFIVGCPRSGTTWLYHLLLASGTFAIYRSESQIYSRFAPAFGGFRSAGARKKFLQQWLGSEFFHRSGLDAERLRKSIVEDARSAADVLKLLMERICRQQRAERWADCTPDHALYVRQIKRDFPDALFIHLVRDGRDVAQSLARMEFIPRFRWHRRVPELAAAAYWSWIVKRMNRDAAFLGSDLLTVHYEQLVHDLEATLQTVALFIGKPVDLQRVTNNPIGSIKDPNTSFAADPHLRGGGDVPRWSKTYDPDSLAAVEYSIGDELRSLGYPVATGNGSRIQALRCSALRRAYFFRFRLGELARNSGYGGIRIPQALECRPTGGGDDPTLRPGRHLERIREIVRP